MDQFQRYGNLLRNDGTNQLQRLSPALESDYILPDERSLSDLLTYARKLAAEIRFYSLTGQSTGNWQPFLDALVENPEADPDTQKIYDLARLEALLQSRRDWPPHLALFVVFLKLFSHLQSDLNELPQRHLRHYYEQQLNLLRRQAQADEVHVIFELARNAAPTLIPAGTLLDAGKDSEGRPLYYATESDLVVNAAQVSDIFRLVGETDRRGFRRFFVAEEISELEGESWYTFGRKQMDLDPSQRFMTEAQMGFAIASPILLMAEGHRELIIKIRLRPNPNQQLMPQRLDAAFCCELTGAEGWITPDVIKAEIFYESLGNVGDLVAFLEITLTLLDTSPAVVAFNADNHKNGPVSAWPVVRFYLNTPLGYYNTLADLIAEDTTLTVNVNGVKDLVVQNSQGTLSPDQPMPLFGTQPRIGSPFYIGSSEVFGKRLTALDLYFTWQDLPEDLFDYYSGYWDDVSNNVKIEFSNYFTVQIDLLYDKNWSQTLKSSAFLFDYFDPTHGDIHIPSEDIELAFGDTQYSPKPQLEHPTAYKIDTQYGFIRLTLQGALKADTETNFEAFGHQMFSTRYATQTIALSRWTEDSEKPEPQLPNQPLTPQLASLSLNYSASTTMVPGKINSEDIWYQLRPFGYAAASDDVPARLVPTIADDITSTIEKDFALGAFYIGLSDFVPPANISLLFQIDKGTADTANIIDFMNQTEWSYLSGNIWVALPRSAILSNSTYGFQEPGLVVLSIGQDASFNHTAMPIGQVWLRALIRHPPESAARTSDLRTQAVQAIFSPSVGDRTGYTDHLQTGLAAEIIQRLKRRTASIKAVQQPYASFGGRTNETDLDFFRRCSERLRHRNRAVTSWDFERLVLETFPEVFKVKCLPYSNVDGEPSAGNIALVIVPDVRNQKSSNSLEPKAGAVLMQRISDYLKMDLATPFAKIHVIHPIYEQIRVDARVAFRSGLDAGYYTEILNQDLQQFLSPWAYEEGKDIVFGSQIYRSEILAFMEGRDYVDFISEFRLYHSHDGPQPGGIQDMAIGLDFLIYPQPEPAISVSEDTMTINDTFVVGEGVEVVTATCRHSILVSHTDHRIIPYEVEEKPCPGVDALGIGYMTIKLDFDVGKTY
jgi:hypothetical protein